MVIVAVLPENVEDVRVVCPPFGFAAKAADVMNIDYTATIVAPKMIVFVVIKNSRTGMTIKLL